MADILTAPSDADNDPRPVSARRSEMLADWTAGMRQVDIAHKYGCSQGMVSRLVGTSPRLKAAPLPTEASASEWRARALLAAALLNHRATPDGLSPSDVEQVRLALAGEWDAA